MERGFDDPVRLGGSDEHDVVTCCDVGDINHDGRNEVIVGTFGQVMLVYAVGDSAAGGSGSAAPSGGTWLKPIWSRKFTHPLIKVGVSGEFGSCLIKSCLGNL